MSSRGNAGLRHAKACRRRTSELLTAGLAQTVAFILLTRVAPSKLAWAGSPSARRIRDFPTLTSKGTTLGWATRPVEAQAYPADLPTHQAARPQANGGRKDSRYPAASCLRINAQPRRRLFRRTPHELPHGARPGRRNHRKADAQAARRDLRGCVRPDKASLRWHLPIRKERGKSGAP
jgi:hypothetical protein